MRETGVGRAFHPRARAIAATINIRAKIGAAALHALPMYLGLDLRGGVHFLLQVDMQAALVNIPRLRSAWNALSG